MKNKYARTLQHAAIMEHNQVLWNAKTGDQTTTQASLHMRRHPNRQKSVVVEIRVNGARLATWRLLRLHTRHHKLLNTFLQSAQELLDTFRRQAAEISTILEGYEKILEA